MQEKKEEIINWIKKHRKELIIAGVVSIAAVITVIIVCKRREDLEDIFASIKSVTEKEPKTLTVDVTTTVKPVLNAENCEEVVGNIIPITHAPHDVKQHIRILPEGRMASDAKKALAEEMNVVLKPGETIVKAYRTGANVA